MKQPPQPSAAAGAPKQRWRTFEESDWQEDVEPPIRPLTRSEAQALIAKYPKLSVWRVIAMQAAFGVLVALVWGVFTNRAEAVLSALYAVGVVVIPSLLMARGVFGPNAGRSVGGLLFWEIAKLGLSGALLALAPVVLRPVDWAALLVTLVLCLKVVGVALFLSLRRTKNSV
ncbi:ATP synthase subunit I [Aquabacterium fontiphilum]|jgi:ATP synthase protein I|uniref:ATP synthase subunit I n=1 Tax=Aquabacterium fontiphilum TaxID=450365 RepID=UPI00137806D4|nr:ATP synthase subunit I [Aquabacterium fontiphilum]NBD19378.1 ATP synthase subunit I [Aquabacterium fontiphilum]